MKAIDLLETMGSIRDRILRLVGGDPQHKVSLLMAHTGQPREVADPWFTGDFEATWRDVLEGCTALLEELRS